MFKNYLKITLRNIKKHKGYSFINIAGLAIGMACTILILLWVQDELSFDKFHERADRIFRVVDYEKYSNGEEVRFTQNPPGLAPVLKAEYPEIVDAIRYRGLGGVVMQYNNKRFNEVDIVAVDPGFFDMFSYFFMKGNSKEALLQPNSIVITERIANKYFGSEDPVGKAMRIDNKLDFLVTGVIKNVPHNSHQQFDFVVPFATCKEYDLDIEGWNGWAFTTYLLLDKNADYKIVGDKIAHAIQKYEEEAIVVLSLQPVKDIHLYSGDMWGIGGTGDIRYVYIFSIIAGFVLIIACINFMNLATARSGNRAKEVGLRKVIGAKRKELIYQFFGESLLLSFLSLAFAIILVELLLPLFNLISSKKLDFDFINNGNILIMLLGIIFFTGIVSGSYPALLLSAFRPAKVLKGSFRSGAKSSVFRKVLVSIQFVFTIFLIIGTLMINRQLRYMRNQKLGFNKEHVLCVNLKGELNRRMDYLKSELKKNPSVIDVCASSHTPVDIKRSAIIRDWEGREANEQFLIYLLSADYDFVNTLQLEMADGRYFSRTFISDTTECVVVNESAVKNLGMDTPIGKRIWRHRIIGVVKDFHFRSLHSKIGPIAIYFSPRDISYLLVRINGKNLKDSIESVETTWNRIVPEFPFEFDFLNERIDKLYRAEQRVEDIMNTFTFLALFVACLGLFGLASFSAEQRTKEVGIRKVLGASVTGIVTLLSREFTKYVIFANIIAWPIAYYAMNKWLQGFAYRIDISIWAFLIAGGIALFIALLTVSYQAIRAAVANPVESLRYE